jgi:hypothetical protein
MESIEALKEHLTYHSRPLHRNTVGTRWQSRTSIHYKLQTYSNESTEKKSLIIYTSLKHDDNLTILNISEDLPRKTTNVDSIKTVTDRISLNANERQWVKINKKRKWENHLNTCKIMQQKERTF